MIGDRKKDIIAGQLAGCRTIFIDRRYNEEKPVKCDKVVNNLFQVSYVRYRLTGGDTMKNMNVKIFADGADKKSMQEMYDKDFISGLTTNPTLMKNAGIDNYESFCREILGFIKSKPISFEVFSDDFDEMYRQAKIINSWADNIYVKVPISNTKGEFSLMS